MCGELGGTTNLEIWGDRLYPFHLDTNRGELWLGSNVISSHLTKTLAWLAFHSAIGHLPLHAENVVRAPYISNAYDKRLTQHVAQLCEQRDSLGHLSILKAQFAPNDSATLVWRRFLERGKKNICISSSNEVGAE